MVFSYLPCLLDQAIHFNVAAYVGELEDCFKCVGGGLLRLLLCMQVAYLDHKSV